MTQSIVEIAKPLGISVHDHIIVGKEGHASLKGLKLIVEAASRRRPHRKAAPCPLEYLDGVKTYERTDVGHLLLVFGLRCGYR